MSLRSVSKTLSETFSDPEFLLGYSMEISIFSIITVVSRCKSWNGHHVNICENAFIFNFFFWYDRYYSSSITTNFIIYIENILKNTESQLRATWKPYQNLQFSIDYFKLSLVLQNCTSSIFVWNIFMIKLTFQLKIVKNSHIWHMIFFHTR